MMEGSMKSALRTLVGSISATAVFAATGFIAAFAREQFLGINLRDWSIQSLTILAGKFAADTFFLILNLAASGWWVLCPGLVLASVAVFFLRHRKTPAYFAPAAECLLAAPILVWLLLSIVRFEAPIIPLHGWILAPSGESPLSTAIRQLHPKAAKAPGYSRKYVQTAISTTAASPGAVTLENYYFSGHTDNPGMLLLEASSDDVGTQLNTIGFAFNKKAAARNSLQSAYAGVAAACLLAFMYIVLSQQVRGAKSRTSGTCPAPDAAPQQPHQGLIERYSSDLLFVLRALVIASLAIAAVLLPFSYGKVIDSTLFPDSSITYIQPSTDTVDGKATLRSGEFPLLGQTDASIFLLWIQSGEGQTQIIEVPKEKIVALSLHANVDVLEKISNCITQKQDVECQSN